MKDLIGLLEEMAELLEVAKTDARRMANGNKSAGTRVRKSMQDLKRKAQEARGLVLDARKG